MAGKADAADRGRRCWVGVASRAHVGIGVAGGFAQVNHGKKAPLQRMHAGDGIAYYSPKTDYPDGETLQAFTAVGAVRTGEVYQADMGGGFVPFRVDVDWAACAEAPIRPLLGSLSFIRDAAHWGAAFRFGHSRSPTPTSSGSRRSMGADPAVLGFT